MSITPNIKLKVLVVDDEKTSRISLGGVLSSLDCHVVSACSGLEAILKAFSSETDVIFLDINMPEIDGFEVVKQLREAGFLAPIAAVTADADLALREKCLKAGCDEYFLKPVSKDQVSSFLNSCIVRLPKEGSGQLDAIFPAIAEDEDDDVIRSLIENFLDSLPERLDGIRDALCERDWKTAQKLSHKLKAAGLFGFPELGTAAGKIEDAVKKGDMDLSVAGMLALTKIVRRVQMGQEAKSRQ